MNNEEIIPERWRAAWNPNDYKATADLEKGKRYPIRIEWLPDGDVYYLRYRRRSGSGWLSGRKWGMISITTSSTESLPWIR